MCWCSHKHYLGYFSFVKIHHNCHNHQTQTDQMTVKKQKTFISSMEHEYNNSKNIENEEHNGVLMGFKIL